MEKEKSQTVDVVIETPRNCRNKYTYDEKKKAFRLTKCLPAGHVFPFDFGFIPDTKGEDGDPLDILVVMDEPTFTGCIISCRVIGALKAEQTEESTVRNDRLIGVYEKSNMYEGLKEVQDMNQNILKQIEHFFISYNEQAGKKFKPMGWAAAEEASTLIDDAKN